MRKITLIFGLLFAIVFTSNAQFHVELGPSFQSPSGDFAEQYELGVGFSLEPRIVLSDKLAVGAYIGALAFAGGDLSGGGGTVDAAGIVPVLGTATFRILDSKVTPYVGGGTGLYTVKSANSEFPDEIVSSSEFGFMARGGIFLGRLNLGASYHLAGDLSFLQFGLGVRIGPW